MRLHGSLNIRDKDLYIGDVKISDIADKYGTPCYIMDENLIRDNIRKFKQGIGRENNVIYAGKTFLNSHMLKILKEEDIGLDVVSDGELFIAKSLSFDMNKIIFHGNNKSYDELCMGVSYGVGRFVCDSLEEVDMIYEISKNYNKKSFVFLRINPGIDAHTHDYIKTACVDSKFGIYKDIDTIQKILSKYKDSENLEIVGLHCHIGSQIFGKEAFYDEIDELFNILNELRNRGFELQELNLGGGFGIYYVDGDEPLSIEEYMDFISSRVRENKIKYELNSIKIYIEPGRSVVGNAGTTIYKIGSVKEIEGVRTYVSVDGGMTDNIRTALYGADYECLLVNKADEDRKNKVTISGKCCESGDVVVKEVCIGDFKRDDILAVFSTGAYCHSMSNNYNKLRRLPVVFVYNSNVKLVSKRESLEDLIRLDV